MGVSHVAVDTVEQGTEQYLKVIVGVERLLVDVHVLVLGGQVEGTFDSSLTIATTHIYREIL